MAVHLAVAVVLVSCPAVSTMKAPPMAALGRLVVSYRGLVVDLLAALASIPAEGSRAEPAALAKHEMAWRNGAVP